MPLVQAISFTRLLANGSLIWLQFKFPSTQPTLETKFPVRRFDFDGRTLSEAGYDLLSSLLTLDPEKRATADDALNHRWYVLLLFRPLVILLPIPRIHFCVLCRHHAYKSIL